MHTTLITPEALAQRLAGPLAADTLVIDCSFDLADPAAGRRQYDAGHLPGAVYLHLDESLSGPKTGPDGVFRGRHPLPDRAAFAACLAALGAHDGTQVVAYDRSGAMYAARLWWLLRWAGHRAAAVLDGGLSAWKAMEQVAGQPLSTSPTPAQRPGTFTLRPPQVETVTRADVLAMLGQPDRQVLDARAADRFRGENETLDPIGGHIPGAVNRPFKLNLADDGRFKPAATLHAEFSALLGGREPRSVFQQCGSGVTACHNLLAMEVAGLSGSVLYPGSWSEWCAQPGAPIATGPSGSAG